MRKKSPTRSLTRHKKYLQDMRRAKVRRHVARMRDRYVPPHRTNKFDEMKSRTTSVLMSINLERFIGGFVTGEDFVDHVSNAVASRVADEVLEDEIIGIAAKRARRIREQRLALENWSNNLLACKRLVHMSPQKFNACDCPRCNNTTGKGELGPVEGCACPECEQWRRESVARDAYRAACGLPT